MAGGLLQLVAYGAQDQLLTGDPVITFFKAIYRHHTNFSMESIRQTFNGSVGPNKRVVCNISRHGDLINDCWLEISHPDAILEKTMIPRIIDSIELEIGGQRIDYHTGDWILKWINLTNTKDRLDILYPTRDIIVLDEGTDAGSMSDDILVHTKSRKTNTLYIPLQFFFCRNPGLALPLIALQYHEVKINITFKPETISSTGDGFPVGTDVELYINYVFLDVDERRRFATTSHQMLIEQLQYHQEFINADGDRNKKIQLNFNHPVKELVIGTDAQYIEYVPNVRIVASGSGSLWEHASGSGEYNTSAVVNNKIYKFLDFEYDSMRILLNGQERFSARKAHYFKALQPYMYHTCGDLQETPLHIYSFALHPEDHQPSGTCNFSRIDNSTIEFQGLVKISSTDNFGKKKDTSVGFQNGANIMIYAINYNILRITSGMGGLAFSN